MVLADILVTRLKDIRKSVQDVDQGGLFIRWKYDAERGGLRVSPFFVTRTTACGITISQVTPFIGI